MAKFRKTWKTLNYLDIHRSAYEIKNIAKKNIKKERKIKRLCERVLLFKEKDFVSEIIEL